MIKWLLLFFLGSENPVVAKVKKVDGNNLQ
jgi:hypothetical protein